VLRALPVLAALLFGASAAVHIGSYVGQVARLRDVQSPGRPEARRLELVSPAGRTLLRLTPRLEQFEQLMAGIQARTGASIEAREAGWFGGWI
jgi:hypothetical protein